MNGPSTNRLGPSLQGATGGKSSSTLRRYSRGPELKNPLLQLAQTIKQAAETFGQLLPASTQQKTAYLSSAPVASRGQVFKSYCINSFCRVARTSPQPPPYGFKHIRASRGWGLGGAAPGVCR